MTTLLMLRTLLTKPLARYILVAVVSVGLTVAAMVRWHQPEPRIIQLDPITKTIEIPVERITTKVVKEYVRVEDRSAVEALLKENDALRVQVSQLTISLAAATSTGSGPVVTTPTTPPVTDTPTLPPPPQTLRFKDWRLDFMSDGTTATYTLTQRFAIINTVGVNDDNVPVQQVRLFEIGPNDERNPIPVSETTTIAAIPPAARWYVKPTLQAGIEMTPTDVRTKPELAGVIAISWWKRGAARAVESTRYALLSPAITLRKNTTTVGILPISLNIGTFPHVPLTDVWVSPYIGLNLKTSQRRFGVAFTATF